MGDRNWKRDRRSPHPHGKQEKTPPKERTISPPPHKCRREEQDGERLKGPVHHSRVLTMPYVTSEDAMSKALN